MTSQVFTFADADSEKPCKAAVTAELQGLCIKPEGTAVFDGDTGPIFLEFQNGRPILYVWTDVNEQEPVKIDLATALESNRKAT